MLQNVSDTKKSTYCPCNQKNSTYRWTWGGNFRVMLRKISTYCYKLQMSAHTVYSNFIYFKVIGIHFNELHDCIHFTHSSILIFFCFLLHHLKYIQFKKFHTITSVIKWNIQSAYTVVEAPYLISTDFHQVIDSLLHILFLFGGNQGHVLQHLGPQVPRLSLHFLYTTKVMWGTYMYNSSYLCLNKLHDVHKQMYEDSSVTSEILTIILAIVTSVNSL